MGEKKNYVDSFYIFLGVIFCILCFMGGHMLGKNNDCPDCNCCDSSKIDAIDQNIKMYIKDKVIVHKNFGRLNGIYYPKEDYYCVWTKNRSISDIEETDRHEYCHALVEKDNKHFCYK